MPATAKKTLAWDKSQAPSAAVLPAADILTNGAALPAPEMREKIDRLAKVRAVESVLKKENEKLTAEVKEALGKGEHKGNKSLVIIGEDPREFFDLKAFKAVHPELAAKFTSDKMVSALRFKPLV